MVRVDLACCASMGLTRDVVYVRSDQTEAGRTRPQ